MKRRSKLLGRIGVLAVHCVLMAGALVMVMPMLWMLATAFKPAPEIALWPPVFLPQAPTFDNFTGAFETAPFGRFFLNSLFIAGVGTLSVIVTSLVAGTVFAKYRFPGRGLLFGMVIATAIKMMRRKEPPTAPPTMAPTLLEEARGTVAASID